MSNDDDKITYVGRYAPSPSGRLHLGNLRTALLAWLHARLHRGRFLLRIDDLDRPRVVAGADQQIMADLTWLGLDWDGEVYYQSQHLADYQQAFESLQSQSLLFPCFCSRKDIQQAASAPHGKSSVYPGNCHSLSEHDVALRRKVKQPAWRYQVDKFIDNTIQFDDGVMGESVYDLQRDCGDFVVKRADKLFAYQLAVVVDDRIQGVTDVLRGEDLLDSTVRQIALFQSLGGIVPQYWHVPLMQDEVGQRMAKRDGSFSIECWQAKGGNAESLVGYLAASLGLVEPSLVISTQALLERLSINFLVERLQCR